MKRIKPSSVIGIIACIIFIPIIVVNLAIIFNGFQDNENMPGFMGYRPAIVLSGSMEPTFDAGDVIVIEKQKIQGTCKKAMSLHIWYQARRQRTGSSA